MKTKILILLLILCLLTVSLFHYRIYQPVKEKLVVTTTTSLYDTGLLEVIEEAFEKKYPQYDVLFISAGTGIALQYASRGDADVVLVHAPKLEKKFLESGYGVNRRIIAYNFFVLIGPQSDPAKISGLNVKDALKKIVKAGRLGKTIWISRGDNSGTHVKEKTLWFSTGFNPEELRKESWFLESGTGMGKTLLLANEKNAYTLTDIGTYLKYFKAELIKLKVFVGEDRELINVYSVIAVNPKKVRNINFKAAIKFINFLVSDEGQGLIGNFGVKEYGKPLFNPAVKLLKENKETTVVKWIKNYGFIEGEECPAKYILPVKNGL